MSDVPLLQSTTSSEDRSSSLENDRARVAGGVIMASTDTAITVSSPKQHVHRHAHMATAGSGAGAGARAGVGGGWRGQYSDGCRSLPTLPPDVQGHLLSFLSATDLMRTGRSCKQLHKACSDNQLWEKLLVHDFFSHADTSQGLPQTALGSGAWDARTAWLRERVKLAYTQAQCKAGMNMQAESRSFGTSVRDQSGLFQGCCVGMCFPLAAVLMLAATVLIALHFDLPDAVPTQVAGIPFLALGALVLLFMAAPTMAVCCARTCCVNSVYGVAPLELAVHRGVAWREFFEDKSYPRVVQRDTHIQVVVRRIFFVALWLCVCAAMVLFALKMYSSLGDSISYPLLLAPLWVILASIALCVLMVNFRSFGVGLMGVLFLVLLLFAIMVYSVAGKLGGGSASWPVTMLPLFIGLGLICCCGCAFTIILTATHHEEVFLAIGFGVCCCVLMPILATAIMVVLRAQSMVHFPYIIAASPVLFMQLVSVCAGCALAAANQRSNYDVYDARSAFVSIRHDAYTVVEKAAMQRQMEAQLRHNPLPAALVRDLEQSAVLPALQIPQPRVSNHYRRLERADRMGSLVMSPVELSAV